MAQGIYEVRVRGYTQEELRMEGEEAVHKSCLTGHGSSSLSLSGRMKPWRLWAVVGDATTFTSAHTLLIHLGVP
jgi:hypothetical protein